MAKKGGVVRAGIGEGHLSPRTDPEQFAHDLLGVMLSCFHSVRLIGDPEGLRWLPEIRSLPGAILMLVLVLYPYVYLLARAAFLEQSVCVLEVSRTLGCSPWSSFRRVALPLEKQDHHHGRQAKETRQLFR